MTGRFDHCTEWIDDDHLCALQRHHSGKCLPLPRRWAVTDISPSNPRYEPKGKTA